MWTAIVVTCPNPSWCRALENEVKNMLRLEGHEAELVLVVPDPGKDERGVGSGGASLNALLVVTEHLSARFVIHPLSLFIP